MIVVTNSAAQQRTMRVVCTTILPQLSADLSIRRPVCVRSMTDALELGRGYQILVVFLSACVHEPHLVAQVRQWRDLNKGRGLIVFRPEGDDEPYATRAVELAAAGVEHIYRESAATELTTWRVLWQYLAFTPDRGQIEADLLGVVEAMDAVLYHEQLLMDLLHISPETSQVTQAAIALYKGRCTTKESARQRLYDQCHTAQTLPPHALLCMFRLLWHAYFVKHNRPREEVLTFLGYDSDTDALTRHINRTLHAGVDDLLAVPYDDMLPWVAEQLVTPWTCAPTKQQLFATLPGFVQRRRAVGGPPRRRARESGAYATVAADPDGP